MRQWELTSHAFRHCYLQVMTSIYINSLFVSFLSLIKITDIFYFYLLRQNEDLMQNCENVIQEWEVDINLSFLNKIFTILH